MQWLARLRLAVQALTRKDLVPWDPSMVRTVGAGLPWLRGVSAEPKLTAPYAQDVWVYACISAIASRLGTLPLQLWRPEGADVTQRGAIAVAKAYRRAVAVHRPFRRCAFRKDFAAVTEGELAALLARPNPDTPASLFWPTVLTHLQLSGNAFVYKERLGVAGGPVRELYVYAPWRLRAVLDANGLLVGWLYQVGAKRIPIAKEDLIHLRLPNPYADYWGLGPAEVARLSIEQDFAANLFNKAFFENYGQVGGVLTFPKALSDAQFQRLLATWRESRAGAAKAYDLLILEGGGEYQDTVGTLKDMAFIELKRMTREEKAAAFGVPPAEVGIFEYANYANAQVQQKQFWYNKLIPLLHYLEGEIQAKLIDEQEPGLIFEADLTGVQALKEELSARVTQAKDLAAMGWPINQINRLLDLGFEDVPWGEDWWINFNLVPARTLLNGAPIEPALPVEDEERSLRSLQSLRSVQSVRKDQTDRTDRTDQREQLRAQMWKSYVAQFQPIEQRYRKAVRDYFYQQRAEVLRRLYANPEALQRALTPNASRFTKAVEEILFELDEQTGKLREVSRPYFREALRRGGQAVWLEVGAGGAFGDETPAAQLRISRMLESVRSIVRHARERVRRAIEAGLNAPGGAESIDQIAERIRGAYRVLSGSQAQTIARTETAKAFNEGRDEAMEQAGVDATEWLSARDEAVREAPYDHRIDGEVRPRGVPFSNGLLYPHDPSGAAANVINCRCVALPVVPRR